MPNATVPEDRLSRRRLVLQGAAGLVVTVLAHRAHALGSWAATPDCDPQAGGNYLEPTLRAPFSPEDRNRAFRTAGKQGWPQLGGD